MQSQMTGLQRSVYRRTALHFCIFYLLIMTLITVVLGESYRREQIDTLEREWNDVSTRIGALVDGKTPGQLTVQEKAELSGILADFCGRQGDRHASTDAVLCWTDGARLYPAVRAGFGTVSFSDPTGGGTKYLFLDEYMEVKELSDLLSHTFASGRPRYVDGANILEGYVDGERILPLKLEIEWYGSVESWSKEFQPESTNGLERRQYRGFVLDMPNFHWIENYEEAKSFQKSREKLDVFLQGPPSDAAFRTLASYGMAKPYYADGYRDGDSYRLLYAADYHPIWLAIRQLLYVYLVGLAAAVFLMNLLSNELSRFVARPIEGLNRAALEMASGKRDVTYRVEKNRNDEIAELADSLNAMARNLNQAMDRLQGEYDRQIEREKQRRELTSAIAHELKTPLGIIHSYCESLQENIRVEKRAHYLDVILDETERMNALVLEMLDLSRMESESFRLQVESFDLAELVQEVVGRYKPAADEKELCVSVETAPDCCITADRGRMEQVLSNFLSNAVRHTPQGKSIDIRVQHLDSTVRLEVENSGPPIPEEQQRKIWEVFYKADASRERAKGGTGLGLAIARHILELHGMQYGVKNTNIGVLFWVAISQM